MHVDVCNRCQIFSRDGRALWEDACFNGIRRDPARSTWHVTRARATLVPMHEAYASCLRCSRFMYLSCLVLRIMLHSICVWRFEITPLKDGVILWSWEDARYLKLGTSVIGKVLDVIYLRLVFWTAAAIPDWVKLHVYTTYLSTLRSVLQFTSSCYISRYTPYSSLNSRLLTENVDRPPRRAPQRVFGVQSGFPWHPPVDFGISGNWWFWFTRQRLRPTWRWSCFESIHLRRTSNGIYCDLLRWRKGTSYSREVPLWWRAVLGKVPHSGDMPHLNIATSIQFGP